MISAVPQISGFFAVLGAVLDILLRVYEKIFTNRIGVGAIVITAIAALLATFIAALHGLATSIGVSIPSHVERLVLGDACEHTNMFRGLCYGADCKLVDLV